MDPETYKDAKSATDAQKLHDRVAAELSKEYERWHELESLKSDDAGEDGIGLQ